MLIGIYLGMNIAGFKSHHDDTDNSNTNYAMKDGATNWLLNEFRGGDTETRRSIALRRDLKSLKERAEGFEASLKASKELSSKYQTSLHKCQEHLEEERSSQQQMNEGGNSNREVATTRKQTATSHNKPQSTKLVTITSPVMARSVEADEKRF